MGIFWLEKPFFGVRGNGGFWFRHPLFPILGILAPLRDSWSKTFLKQTIFCASFLPFSCPVHPTLPRQFSSPKSPLSRTSRAGGKGPRKKTSKIVKKCQKYFRHLSTIFAQGKKRQKSSKKVKIIFDTFRQFSRGTNFPAPFGGLRKSTLSSRKKATCRG